MILYLDRSRSAMIMPGSWGQNLEVNLNINKQLIHKFAHFLYSNVNRSCFRHPLCDLSQDRQLSELRPSSLSIFVASDPTRDVHNKIYSLNIRENLLTVSQTTDSLSS